jgi:hypothetical protein
VEASFDPTITELEQHAVPAFDRSGSTFALKIFCNKINMSLRLYVRLVLAAPMFGPPLLGSSERIRRRAIAPLGFHRSCHETHAVLRWL